MEDSKLRLSTFARKGQSARRKSKRGGIILSRRAINGNKFGRLVASKLRSAKAWKLNSKWIPSYQSDNLLSRAYKTVCKNYVGRQPNLNRSLTYTHFSPNYMKQNDASINYQNQGLKPNRNPNRNKIQGRDQNQNRKKIWKNKNRFKRQHLIETSKQQTKNNVLCQLRKSLLWFPTPSASFNLFSNDWSIL